MDESPVTQAVLLVGGLGTRLRPLTYQRPKALLPLLNRPLISYELELFARHGVTNIVMAVGYGAQQIQAALGDGGEWGVRLRYVVEEERLDTAGAIKNCEALIDGPFFACNGDIVYDFNPAALARFHLQKEALVTFCLRQVENISPYGLIQRNDDGSVRAFREKIEHDETGQNTVNAGFYVMDPEVLQHIPANEPYSNEKELFPALLQQNKPLYGWVAYRDGYWSDVGRIETYMETHRRLLHGAIPWAEVGDAPDTDTVRGPVLIADSASVHPSAQIGPHVTIGDGCTIEPHARIEATILWPDVTVGEGAHLTNTIAATGVEIDSGARIRDGVIMPTDD
ncbi:MAG: NDP-sugar synthase [Armatimonadota bacterium]